MFWLILIVIIVCIIMSNKKSTVKEPKKLPSPWDSVRYVKMIYREFGGSEEFTWIEETSVDLAASASDYEYYIFIDSSSFTNKMLVKSFVLLDENKNQISIPSHYYFSYDDRDESRDFGYIYFYKKV